MSAIVVAIRFVNLVFNRTRLHCWAYDHEPCRREFCSRVVFWRQL